MGRQSAIVIETWSPTHQRWGEWRSYAQAAGLVHGIIDEHGLKPESRFLAALWGGQLVAVLMFLTQPIGPEMDVPVICGRDGRPLTEAKIRAFHVLPDHRNQGIGTALQQEAIRLAGELGCYQVRSRSELSMEANYSVKLKLGFVLHPAVRTLGEGRDSAGVYWVKKT